MQTQIIILWSANQLQMIVFKHYHLGILSAWHIHIYLGEDSGGMFKFPLIRIQRGKYINKVQLLAIFTPSNLSAMHLFCSSWTAPKNM